MQENNELPTYSPEEVEQLIVMTEDLQTENEQQREELRKLHRQLQTSSSDNQRLSAELEAAIQNTKELKAKNEKLRMKLDQADQLSSQTQQRSSELLTALSKIQKLLSDNQKLRSQVQQLTVRNESLQRSDEQLKHAEDLKKQSEKQEKQVKERERQATIAADRAKHEANAAIAAAKKKEDEAQTAKNAAEQIKRQQKSLIQEKAKELNSQFRNKWMSVAAILVTYSLLSTVLTAFNSERCVSDIKAAGQLISKVFMAILKVIYTIATGAGSIGTHIKQPVASAIVTYLVDIIVAALCVGVIGAGLFFGGKAIVNCYTDHCWDEISPLVALCSLAILIWGAELMPLNIVLLLILSHAAYIIVRWYIDGYKEAR